MADGMTKLKIGATYWIEHSRKGSFVGQVLRDDGEWADVKILQGRIFYLSISNNLKQTYGKGMVGDVITVRKSLATFTPAKREKAGNWVLRR